MTEKGKGRVMIKIPNPVALLESWRGLTAQSIAIAASAAAAFFWENDVGPAIALLSMSFVLAGLAIALYFYDRKYPLVERKACGFCENGFNAGDRSQAAKRTASHQAANSVGKSLTRPQVASARAQQCPRFRRSAKQQKWRSWRPRNPLDLERPPLR